MNCIASECIIRIFSLQIYLTVLFVPYLSGKVKASNHYWKISLNISRLLQSLSISHEILHETRLFFYIPYSFDADNTNVQLLSGVSSSMWKKLARYFCEVVKTF